MKNPCKNIGKPLGMFKNDALVLRKYANGLHFKKVSDKIKLKFLR